MTFDGNSGTKSGIAGAAPEVKWHQRKRARAAAQAPFRNVCLVAQRLENWKLRRAFARPYFLRSTTRESRVRKPPLFSTGRRPGS